MSGTIHGFLFDMDGVIIDSMPMHTQTWVEYLAALGVEVDDLATRMHGRKNEEIVRDFLDPTLDLDKAAWHGEQKEILYREKMGPLVEQHLIAGVREFLSHWAEFPKAIGTNAEMANVDLVLSKAKLEGVFHAIVDASQVRRPKPWPDVYLRAAVLLDLSPQECVVFEDSPAGVAAARDAGAYVIGVESHGALKNVDLAVRDFAGPELEQWLRSRTGTRESNGGGAGGR